MKALVISEFSPLSDEGDITGGVESITHFLFAKLREEMTIEVISRPGKFNWSDASIKSIPSRGVFLLRAIYLGLRKDFDVVVGMTFVTYPVAWFLGVVKKRPRVFWYHDVLIGRWQTFFGRRAGFLGECVERMLLKLPNVDFIANSNVTANRLRAVGVSRVQVVYCGVEASSISDMPREEPNRLQILCICRLVAYKQVDVVIEALSLLTKSFPNLLLVVVGQGPELSRLEKLVVECGVSKNVKFVGFLSTHADVMAELRKSTLFVSASRVEGFGIVAVEAMSQGVPAVLSDIPAFREVEGGSGAALFFDSLSSDELAEKIGELLNSDDLRLEMSLAGIKRAKMFTWEMAAKESAKFFQSL